MSSSLFASPDQARPVRPRGPSESLSSAQLRERVADAAHHAGVELVVIDVRETLPFTESHLIFSTNLPHNRLELEAPVRIPRRNVPLVVVDGDGTLLDVAQRRLRRLGYTNIAVLPGGIRQWQQDGFPTYAGFNVRSKAFAEVVEHHAGTPAVDFEALRDLLNGPPVVLDSRTRDEYHNATIPSAFHAPGADLVRVVKDLVPNAGTPIVVACGGRTRSIIGAQSLIDAGVPNPVFSLRNGTGGLRLAGHEREHGATRFAAPPSATSLAWASSAVKKAKPDVPVIDASALAAWCADHADRYRTLYVLDLRDAPTREALPVLNALPIAGGQLVQEIDLHAAVIGARVLLVDDDDLVRATMTASWLQRLGGLEVAIVSASTASKAGPADAHAQNGSNAAEAAPVVPPSATVTAAALANALETAADDVVVIDLSLSPAFRRGHIPRAQWALRDSWHHVWRDIGATKRVVLTSEDGRLAALAWADWSEAEAEAEIDGSTDSNASAMHSRADVRVLAGGNRAWVDAAFPTHAVIENGTPVAPYPDVWLGPQQRGGDVLPHVRAYLDWEIDLVRQVEHDPDFHALLQLSRLHPHLRH